MYFQARLLDGGSEVILRRSLLYLIGPRSYGLDLSLGILKDILSSRSLKIFPMELE